MRKGAWLLGTAAGVALVGIAVGLVLGRGERAEAQGFPPSPPATFWGEASGVPAGTRVVALVVSGSGSAMCGVGSVLLDAGATKYVVDVFHESQQPGCGAPGRAVRFYFSGGGPANGGRLANETGTWSEAGPAMLNLSAGPQLMAMGTIPGIARQP